MYRILTGKAPWSKGIKKIKNKQKRTETLLKEQEVIENNIYWPDDVPQEAREVVLACLKYNHAKRVTSQEILLYDWFQEKEVPVFTKKLQKRLRKYANRSKLQKALTPIMVKHLEDQDSVMCKWARKLHDTVGGELNELNFKSFQDALKEIRRFDEYNQKEIFDAIDVDHSGTISLHELILWVKYDSIVKEDLRLLEFLKTLDENGDGYITYDEIEKAIKSEHEHWEPYLEEFEKAMRGNDYYTLQDFASIFRRYDVKHSFRPNSMQSSIEFETEAADDDLKSGLSQYTNLDDFEGSDFSDATDDSGPPDD